MKLSPTMEKAAQFAKQNNGKLFRHPGGFWAGPRFHDPYSEEYYGANTIHGLVTREIAEYSDWQQGRNGRFAVEITLTNKQG